VAGRYALDLRDACSQIIKDGRIGHGTDETRIRKYVPYMFSLRDGRSQWSCAALEISR
jgi:hypothetical protein